ncbi:hypothetical protein [Nocardia pseudovaccinii]|nr:hypothetical protein [Nocardia pseudovaccinii]
MYLSAKAAYRAGLIGDNDSVQVILTVIREFPARAETVTQLDQNPG